MTFDIVLSRYEFERCGEDSKFWNFKSPHFSFEVRISKVLTNKTDDPKVLFNTPEQLDVILAHHLVEPIFNA